MSGNQSLRALLVIPLTLAILAGCTDSETTAPKLGSTPLLAQGANGIWTVNSLADPGDGTCDDANCTLREAVAAASPGDQVVVAAGLSGTIQLASFGISVDKDLSIDGSGRIELDAHGASHTLILGGDIGPITVTLDGLTLKNGFSSDGKGANVRLDPGLVTATVTIRNSVVVGGNSTLDGGGIYVASQHALTLVNSTVSGNTAAQRGGGIWNAGSLTITNSTIDGNDASMTLGAGGGIRNSGTLSITGSTISNNAAFNGGGLDNAAGGSATLVRSTIAGNTAAAVAGPLAGGISNGGTLNLLSSTITGNTKHGLTVGGLSFVANTIVAGNAGACDILGGNQVSLGHNLSDFNAACDFDAATDVSVLKALVFTQVLEQELKDNGGPTRTHALLARGLAVDAGSCPGETADQRGFTRPVDDPTMPNALDGCDIGAYEAQGPSVAVADLMVSQAVDKNSVKQGELLTYTVRVQNLGPQTAPGVVLNNVLSSGVTFVEARQNKGSITAPPAGETGTVTWNLGDMDDQANEIAEIVVTVLVKGRTTITNTATVTGNVTDPNEANNTAAITVSVVAGRSGGKKG